MPLSISKDLGLPKSIEGEGPDLGGLDLSICEKDRLEKIKIKKIIFKYLIILLF
tara:strand:+ start:499 stop:660 length:162 start_codon:yes stop_codon:yes gene_type:complete